MNCSNSPSAGLTEEFRIMKWVKLWYNEAKMSHSFNRNVFELNFTFFRLSIIRFWSTFDLYEVKIFPCLFRVCQNDLLHLLLYLCLYLSIFCSSSISISGLCLIETFNQLEKLTLSRIKSRKKFLFSTEQYWRLESNT